MSIEKKKPDTSPAAGADAAAEEAADLDAVMRKYDRESATRMWEGTPQMVIRVLMAVFGVFCIGMTLFSKDMPEIRLTLFVGCIVIIGFLTYPASKHHVRVNYLPWYDIVLMVVGAFCFFYFALNAMTLVRAVHPYRDCPRRHRRGGHPDPDGAVPPLRGRAHPVRGRCADRLCVHQPVELRRCRQRRYAV